MYPQTVNEPCDFSTLLESLSVAKLSTEQVIELRGVALGVYNALKLIA